MDGEECVRAVPGAVVLHQGFPLDEGAFAPPGDIQGLQVGNGDGIPPEGAGNIGIPLFYATHIGFVGDDSLQGQPLAVIQYLRTGMGDGFRGKGVDEGIGGTLLEVLDYLGAMEPAGDAQPPEAVP